MGIVRSTFLIDEKGKIAKIWSNLRVRGHVDKVLEAAQSRGGLGGDTDTVGPCCWGSRNRRSGRQGAGRAGDVLPTGDRGSFQRSAMLRHATRPKRPMKPDLLLPRDMPRRGKAQTLAGRIALLHAIAHIELNAVDLAADILVRFPDAGAPLEFYNDWLGVLDDEAKHFLLMSDRLTALGAAYGDLPAHDGLWQAALGIRRTIYSPASRSYRWCWKPAALTSHRG